MSKAPIIVPDSLQNVEEAGKITGFKFKASTANCRTLNGRGCWLSLVDGFYLAVDGELFGRETQSIEIHGQEPRTMDEVKKATWEHWGATEYAWIHVKKDGGLGKGEHKIAYLASVLSAYFKAQDEWLTNPPPFDEHMQRPDEIEENTFTCTLA